MTMRDRLMVAVLAAAALIAAGWFLVLSPRRDEASGLASQIAEQRQARNAALADIAAGLQAKRGYAHAYAEVARLGAAVPDDDNVPSLMLQSQQAANVSQIDFRSLKVGTSSNAAVVPPPAATPTVGAPATQATTATLPPGAAVGTAGFPTMPFSFEFDGSFFRLSDFMGRLERFLVVRNRKLAVSGRFMTIDGIGLSAGAQGFPKIKASVAATTYLLPTDQGLTDGATPSGPAVTPAAAPTSGGATAAPATATSPVP
jgi:hypothetical protein